MLENIRFDRNIAVEQGLRKSAEIDKGCFKRPILNLLKRKPYPEINSAVDYIYKTVPSRLASGVNINSYFKDDKAGLKEADYVRKVGMSISLEEAIMNEKFKNKTIIVYVEKQHKEVYTLRELKGKMPFVAEVNLGGFYDIAGKAVLINLSKKKGEYNVSKIIKIIKD